MASSGWFSNAVLLAAIALFLFQLSALVVSPRPDCDRWHGDETWLMREFQTQVTTGVMRYPEAEGSTIGSRNNFLLSSMWLNAAVYGAPASLFFPRLDEITIGRTVTAVVSLITICALFLFSVRSGASRDIASLMVLILVASRNFFLTSHSARYDMWVGLGVMLALYGAVLLRQGTALNTASWFAIGLGAAAMLAWNMHTFRIAALLIPWLFLSTGSYRNMRDWLGAIGGCVTGFAILLLAYGLANGSLSGAFGIDTHTQFRQTTQDIPVLHPFSVLLYFANLHIRLTQFASEAPIVLVAICFAGVAGIAGLVQDKKASRRHPTFTLQATAIVALVWMITIRPLPYYLMHILPALMFFATLVLSSALTGFRGAARSITIGAVAIVTIVAGYRDATVAIANGRIVTGDLSKISQELREKIHITVRDQARTIAEVPFVNAMLQDTDVHVISPYFLIFPADTLAPPAFLRNRNIRYVAVEGSRLILPSHFPLGDHGYDADSIGKLVGQWTGQFDDNHRDYFRPFRRWTDTVSLFEVRYE